MQVEWKGGGGESKHNRHDEVGDFPGCFSNLLFSLLAPYPGYAIQMPEVSFFFFRPHHCGESAVKMITMCTEGAHTQKQDSRIGEKEATLAGMYCPLPLLLCF